MSIITTLDLQYFYEKYQNTYLATTPLMAPSELSFSLRFPFNKIYSLGENRKQVLLTRQHFESNSRIQIFLNTHQGSFFEMVRMIPIGFVATFLLEDGDSQLEEKIKTIGRIRPIKRDIIISDVSKTEDLAALTGRLYKVFGHSHSFEIQSPFYLMMFPIRRRLRL